MIKALYDLQGIRREGDYSWGARNVELHVAQILGPVPSARGVAFPTFLPESA